jgi:hypothetical protein
MKSFLFALSVLTLGGCYTSGQIQVEVANAQLVRIDTVYRYQTENRVDRDWQPEQQLTWRDDNNNTYVSYASLDEPYIVGTKMAILRKK